MLAPHLTNENVDGLIAAATHKGKSEIEVLLVRRFGSGIMPQQTSSIRPVAAAAPAQLAPGRVEDPLFAQASADPASGADSDSGEHSGTGFYDQLAPGRVEVAAESSPPEEYLVRLRISKSTHDKLRDVQDLLGHRVPPGDLAQVFDRALDALKAKLEKRKWGARISDTAGRA